MDSAVASRPTEGTLARGFPVLGVAAMAAIVFATATFAAMAASGDGWLVSQLFRYGPFVDLRDAPSVPVLCALLRAAMISGGAGVVAGLIAVRRGWRPSPRLLLCAGSAAVVLFLFLPAAGASDIPYYAEYGRIVVLGHNPWRLPPQWLYDRRDPVGLWSPWPWRDQPTVYGPTATAEQTAAAALGGTSVVWIAFWLKIVNAAAYIGVAVLLDRAAGGDPARRARAAMLWTVNPLMLFWEASGAHVDLLAALLVLAALVLLRSHGDRRWAWPVAGVLTGLATGVKITYGAPAAVLLAASWWHRTDRRRPALAAVAFLVAGAVLATGYAVAGPAALSSLSHRLADRGDAFLPLPASVFENTATYTAVTGVLILLLVALLAWRLPAAHPEQAAVRAVLAVAIAVVLVAPVQYPWYDVMVFPLIALMPPSGFDAAIVARSALIGCLIMPGIAIPVSQFEAERILVPVFLAVFVVATAFGRLSGPYPAAAVKTGR